MLRTTVVRVYSHLEHEVHAIFSLIKKASADLSILKLYSNDPTFRIVQENNGHTDPRIACHGHCDDGGKRYTRYIDPW